MNRRTGKIARFPKDLRELVNNMLDDGAEYTSVIRELEKHRHRWPDGVHDLSVNNLSNWHSGGYQDWVRHQEVAADLRARHEAVLELMEGTDPARLHETVLHVGLAQLYHTIAGFDRDGIEALSTKDPAGYARLLGVCQRFSQHTLALRKLKLQGAANEQAQAAPFQPKTLPLPSTPESRDSEHNSRSTAGNSR